MLYSGIDLHKRLIVICTVNSEGTVVARSRMKTESDAVVTYFRQIPIHPVVQCSWTSSRQEPFSWQQAPRKGAQGYGSQTVPAPRK